MDGGERGGAIARGYTAGRKSCATSCRATATLGVSRRTPPWQAVQPTIGASLIRGKSRMARNFRRTVLFCAVLGSLHATAFAQESDVATATEQSTAEQSAPAGAVQSTDVDQATATPTATDLDKVVVVGSRLAGNSET